jgi:hypothetical protein
MACFGKPIMKKIQPLGEERACLEIHLENCWNLQVFVDLSFGVELEIR